MGGDGGELPASFKECEAPMAETSISKQESEMIKIYNLFKQKISRHFKKKEGLWKRFETYHYFLCHEKMDYFSFFFLRK